MQTSKPPTQWAKFTRIISNIRQWSRKIDTREGGHIHIFVLTFLKNIKFSTEFNNAEHEYLGLTTLIIYYVPTPVYTRLYTYCVTCHASFKQMIIKYI